MSSPRSTTASWGVNSTLNWGDEDSGREDAGVEVTGVRRSDLLAFPSEHRLRSENLPFDIDVWYRPLADATFRSEFIPLKRRECSAILRAYRERYNVANDRPLDADDIAAIRALEEKIDVLLKHHFSETGAFMRLCGRSPKDGEPLDRDAVLERYTRALQGIAGGRADGADGIPDGNTRLRAVARVDWLRVTSGAEAMSLLLSSERASVDLLDCLRWGEPEQLVFREWSREMRMDREFRVFICDRRVTGISQYDHYTHYPELAALEGRIRQAIVPEAARLLPRVGVDSCCMDFLFVEGEADDDSEDVAILIELSPFRRCTGPALFNWDADGAQLREGGPDGVVEVRLRLEPHPEADLLVTTNWEERWRTPEPRYSEVLEMAMDRSGQSPREPQKAAGAFHRARTLLFALCSACAAWLAWSHASTNQSASPSAVPLPAPLSCGVIAVTVVCVSLGALHLRDRSRATSASTKSLEQETTIFVYGTLRKDYHWHDKYLGDAEPAGHATTTEALPLVVGECGVPYVLGDVGASGLRIVGELWRVDKDTLQGLDDYEGVNKSYYGRRTIRVERHSGGECEAEIYVLERSTPALRAAPRLQEYTKAMHDECYRPVAHIMAKQERYLEADDSRI